MSRFECVSEPSYLATMHAALTSWKALALGALVALIYLVLFALATGLLSRVSGSQFSGTQDLPRFELYLDPPAYMPYLAYQPVKSWYLEINVTQAAAIFVIGLLVVLNVAFSGLIWRLTSRQSRSQTTAGLAGVVPFLVSNGACAACAGIPAGLGFLPASLAGGLVAFAQFYGLPAILTVMLLTVTVIYSLYRANTVHVISVRTGIPRPRGISG